MKDRRLNIDIMNTTLKKCINEKEKMWVGIRIREEWMSIYIENVATTFNNELGERGKKHGQSQLTNQGKKHVK